jgi:hypothetical protein
VLAVQPLVLVLHENSPVEVSWCGAPGECSVKSTSGSLWPATQALSCHAVQMSTWVPVSVFSPLLYSSHSSLATVSDHLVKISELNSQTLLCDAVS